MKKSIYIFAAMALFGCNMAEYAPVEPATNSIKASIEVEDTKTSVTDAGYFTWSEGDKIWLDTTNGGIEGVLAEGAGSSNATFTYGSVFGEITFKAVYPYGNHSISENTLTVNLPASYDLGDNTDNTNAAMYAILVDGNLKFTHLAGVMRFEFRNAPVGTNQFKITVDKKINGDFTADLTKDYPTLTTVEATSEEEKTITINFTPLKEKKNLRIYIPLPTGTYDSLSLELNAGENAVYTYSKAISNTINRKSLKLMPVITPGGSIGGDIENDDSIEGDIENNELFINCEANNAAFSSEGGENNEIYLISNAETLISEPLTESPWISIELFKSNTENKWIIEATAEKNNTSDKRVAEFKVYPQGKPDTYVVLQYEQVGQGIYMNFVRRDEYGIADGAEIKNVTATSCDYTVKALADNPNYEGSGYIYNALVFETNLTDYTYVVPEEDQSWLIVGYDLSQNTILIKTNPNEEGAERRSKIEITDRQKNTVYYTINVIQKAEPKEGDYIDEYGINHGQGIAINNVVWAPVNCGYHATDYKNGKFYQWGRKYGHGATPKIAYDLTSMEEGQLESNSGRFYTNWPNKIEKDLWNSGTEEKPVKTDYDPCPTGWRVPTESELIALIMTKVIKDGALPGIWFNKENTPKIFFPASGWITSSGTLGSENVAGGFWSSNAYVGCFFNANAQVANRSAHYDDARSYSVRCVKEAK